VVLEKNEGVGVGGWLTFLVWHVCRMETPHSPAMESTDWGGGVFRSFYGCFVYRGYSHGQES
jgi:hypothetical protein